MMRFFICLLAVFDTASRLPWCCPSSSRDVWVDSSTESSSSDVEKEESFALTGAYPVLAVESPPRLIASVALPESEPTSPFSVRPPKAEDSFLTSKRQGQYVESKAIESDDSPPVRLPRAEDSILTEQRRRRKSGKGSEDEFVPLPSAEDSFLTAQRRRADPFQQDAFYPTRETKAEDLKDEKESSLLSAIRQENEDSIVVRKEEEDDDDDDFVPSPKKEGSQETIPGQNQ